MLVQRQWRYNRARPRQARRRRALGRDDVRVRSHRAWSSRPRGSRTTRPSSTTERARWCGPERPRRRARGPRALGGRAGQPARAHARRRSTPTTPATGASVKLALAAGSARRRGHRVPLGLPRSPARGQAPLGRARRSTPTTRSAVASAKSWFRRSGTATHGPLRVGRRGARRRPRSRIAARAASSTSRARSISSSSRRRARSSPTSTITSAPRRSSSTPRAASPGRPRTRPSARWSRPTSIPPAAAAVESPFRLLGQYADDETGLTVTPLPLLQSRGRLLAQPRIRSASSAAPTSSASAHRSATSIRSGSPTRWTSARWTR